METKKSTVHSGINLGGGYRSLAFDRVMFQVPRRATKQLSDILELLLLAVHPKFALTTDLLAITQTVDTLSSRSGMRSRLHAKSTSDRISTDLVECIRRCGSMRDLSKIVTRSSDLLGGSNAPESLLIKLQASLQKSTNRELAGFQGGEA